MGSGGRIVNITSSITKNPNPEASVYAGTKAALETITRSLAAELGSRQITVNAVGSGVVSTDMLNGMISPEWQQSLIADTPLGRLGMPEDIADVVAFWCLTLHVGLQGKLLQPLVGCKAKIKPNTLTGNLP
jgi:3-oxoacyl-[acyl-carrier protein] reductase